ncbi:MAG: superinfection immunity protein [Nitrospirales bacterium]|jgi:hypothetical protein
MSDGAIGLLTIIFFIGVFFACVALYFLPTIVAYQRKHHQLTPILILNLFFGWTMLGWVGALIWSYGHIGRSIRAEQGLVDRD